MAITDLDVFAHLTDADIENLGVELDAIRRDIEDSRGERDARYIHRTIAAQRALEVAGRLMLALGKRRSAWWAGTATLGVAKILQHVEIGKNVMGRMDNDQATERVDEFLAKAGGQVFKDYVAFPALTSMSPWASFKSTLKANIVANIIRNVWANAIIFCGHFPDGAAKFTKTDMVGESKGQWYLRQMLGSANINAGPVMRFRSGSLSHQIEHHLFPDLPSNRYEEIAVRVRQICDKYDLPYTTGPFLVQYGKTWRTIAKLSLPDKYLRDTADNAPETRSESMFAELEPGFAGIDPSTGRRRGLKTAIAAVRGWRRAKRAAAEAQTPGRDDLAA